MQDLFEHIFRAFLSYFVLFLLARLMGKREMAQLTYFDYIAGITIGSLTATITLDTNVGVWSGLVTVVIFVLLQLIVAMLTFKSRKIRKILDGERRLIIQNGHVIDKNLKKERFNIDELLMKLRENDIFNLDMVDMAFLEPDGEVTVLKKTSKDQVTKEDLQITVIKTGVGQLVIERGKIIEEVLRNNHLTKAWLIEQLESRGTNLTDVMYAQIDDVKSIYIDHYDN